MNIQSIVRHVASILSNRKMFHVKPSASLAYTETAEYFSKQVIRREFTGNAAQRFLGQPQLLGQQLRLNEQVLSIKQMLPYRLQRL